MKTNQEVLESAIQILERDGVWCQNKFYDISFEGGRIGYCAEGAILEAAGFWDHAKQEIVTNPLTNGLEVSWQTTPRHDGDPEYALALRHQCRYICDRILVDGGLAEEGYTSVNQFNDAPERSSLDVILAMKKTLEEM